MTTPGNDEKLRDLERRWRQTRSVEDETAYLIERVRVGDLTLERLALAAHCWHEAAKSAVGWLPDAVHEDPERWVRAVPTGPNRRAALVVIAFHAAWYVRDLWKSEYPQDPRPMNCLDAVARWICSQGCTDNEVSEAMCAATDAWREEMFEVVPRGDAVSAERWAACRAAEAASHAASLIVVKDRRGDGRHEDQAVEAIREVTSAFERLGRDIRRESSALLLTIRAGTARWALDGSLPR